MRKKKTCTHATVNNTIRDGFSGGSNESCTRKRRCIAGLHAHSLDCPVINENSEPDNRTLATEYSEHDRHSQIPQDVNEVNHTNGNEESNKAIHKYVNDVNNDMTGAIYISDKDDSCEETEDDTDDESYVYDNETTEDDTDYTSTDHTDNDSDDTL